MTDDAKQTTDNSMSNVKHCLQQYVCVHQIMCEAGDCIGLATSFDDGLQAAVDIICQTMQWDLGHAFHISDEGRREAVSTSIWHLEKGELYLPFVNATDRIERYHEGYGLPGRVLQSQEITWVSDLNQDVDSPRRLLDNFKIKGGFALPIINESELIAVLEFFSDKEILPSDEFIHLMMDVGRQVGSLLSQKKLEKELQDQKFAIDQSALVSKTDVSGKVTYVNDRFVDMSGYERDELIGNTHGMLRSGEQHDNLYSVLWRKLKRGRTWHGEMKNRAKDGSYYWVSMTIVPILDNEGKPCQYLSVCYDITDKKSADEKIETLAYYDSVTELPNRRLLKENLNFLIGQCQHEQSSLAVLYVDIDNFKRINDTFGHKYGDTVLERISEILSYQLKQQSLVNRICFRHRSDAISRLAGDQFAVVLTPGVTQQEIIDVVDAIKAIFANAIVIEGRELMVTMSVGVSVFPSDGNDADSLLKNAEAAVNDVKEDGKNDFRFYNVQMNEDVARKLMLDNELRKAVMTDSLQLYFQPKLDLRTGKINSHEALLRWQHPELGWISPLEFISLAEETKLIVDIGDWVLKQACLQTKRWQDAGYTDMSVAVNASMRQFSGDFVSSVNSVLQETGLRPESLEIEITESAMMKNSTDTFEKLKQLSDMGVFIAIDDFGTGYSSLRYLQQFPIDLLKIDREFVRNCPENEEDVALCHMIISLAKMMNMTLVAEDVETQEQYDFLEAQGCEYLQGYLISKPLPTDEIEQMMNDSDYYQRPGLPRTA